MRRDHCSGDVDGWFVEHCGAFPPLSPPLDEVCHSVEHTLPQPGGEIQDGLHPGERLLSVPKYLRPGTQAQPVPLLGYGVPMQGDLEGAPALPWDAHMSPTLTFQAATLI